MAFVTMSRWLGLNKDQSERMGEAATDGEVASSFGKANSAVQNAGRGLDFGNEAAVNDADVKLKALQGLGGRTAQMEDNFGRGRVSALDAAFAGNSQAMGNAYAQMANVQQRHQQAQQGYEQQQAEQAHRRAALQRFQDMQEENATPKPGQSPGELQALMDRLYDQMTEANKFGEVEKLKRLRAQWEALLHQKRQKEGWK